MPLENLNQKYFSRERVRNRMLKRAAEIWGFAESEMDDFDPLVMLLIEACAVEFEKIAGEIGKSQNRMLESLSHLLHPGTIAVRPSYGIVQVRSSEPAATLWRDAQFLLKPSESERKRDSSTTDLCFSPVNPIKIFDGTIRYIASARELFEIEEGYQKLPVASSSKKTVDHQHSVWLGIDLHDDIESFLGVSFFFNWINQPGSKSWYPYLPYLRWFAGDAMLKHEQGLIDNDDQQDAAGRVASEFDGMQSLEQEILALFNFHYATITSKETFSGLKFNRRNYPVSFETLFDKKDLKELKDPLYWLEIKFPTAIPEEALDTISCSINAVPVLNRKLNQVTYKLGQALNIVPLETEGIFLSVKEIFNSSGQPVKLVPFANPADLSPETYTLRYGINRFDDRDLREILTNLTELIKEESSYFSALGEDFLIHNIRELNQVLARIEDKLKVRNKSQSPYPYLIIKPQREGANVMIEFWSCNGELANKIPVGSRLSPYQHSNVKSNSIHFITSTFGGRDKFNDAQKIDQYKKLLVTHNRIVTLFDLETFVNAELGKSVKSVDFKKVYIKSEKPGEGFVQCMQISIRPEPGSLEVSEWENRLSELKLQLEKRSVNNLPYALRLTE